VPHHPAPARLHAVVFPQALYTEGCDVAHLLEGLGDRGITKLFHNLSILAWATVIAKGVELLAPWEEQSPLFKFIGENFSHQAADMVLEGQELLITAQLVCRGGACLLYV
jgi:hypothetical protein